MKASCHCGAVKIEVTHKPEHLTSCNCSICHRLGAMWAYYTPEEVAITAQKGQLVGYEWGDKDIAFHHCATCGAPTHWASTDKYEDKRIAVNGRMFDPAEIADIPVRRFDGRDSWRFIED